MKALSIRQPWAELIVAGVKPVENRSWSTKYRGPILIHAAKAFDMDGFNWINREFGRMRWANGQWAEPHDFNRGGVIGSAWLVDCVDSHPSPWFFGEFGFVLDRAKRLQFKSCRGRLGLFNLEYTDI